MPEQKQAPKVQLNDLRKDDIVNLQLKNISSYYNSFLKEFQAIIISATNNGIIIKSPVKNDVVTQWPIHKDEILVLQLVKQ